MPGADPIALVEGAYDLGAATREAWIAGMLEPARWLAKGQYGAVGFAFDLRRSDWLGEVVLSSDAPREIVEVVHRSYAEMPIAQRDFLFSGVPAARTASANVTAGASLETHAIARDVAQRGRFEDAIVVCARDITAAGCILAVPLPRPTALARGELALWDRVSRHIVAAMRLREALSAGPLVTDAVLDSDGRTHDASAQGAPMRGLLRAAVRARERARGPMRRRSHDEALALWRALIAGRWSLLDRFESDGRRYIVAVRNAPSSPDPRGLTPREQTIAAYLALGHSNKLVAYALGISEGAVAALVHRIARKLRVRSRSELVRVLNTGARAEVVGDAVRIGAAEVAVLCERGPTGLDGLTPNQERIVARVLAGESNAEIAAALARSPHTVANTLHAIFRKVGVSSRAELARRATQS